MHIYKGPEKNEQIKLKEKIKKEKNKQKGNKGRRNKQTKKQTNIHKYK